MADENERSAKAKRREESLQKQQASRDAKLKKALRENLARRKQKARANPSTDSG